MITQFLKTNMKALLKVLFNVKVEGNVATLKQKKLIMTPNHVSFLDGILIGTFLPVKPVFAIYSGYYDHWVVRLGRRFIDFVPIDPTNPMAIKRLVREVQKGRPLVIFPEGRITVTGSLMKIYDGAAFIAAKSGATIVPIWLEGAEFTLLSRLKGVFKRRLFPQITIHVLKPETIPMPHDTKASRRYLVGEKLHKIMMQARMESRSRLTLFEALLEAQIRYGIKSPIVKDMTFKEESYRALLKKLLGIGRFIEKITSRRERVGVLLPNVTITIATILGISVIGRVPAMLNYTAGVKGLRSAIDSTEMKTIITSRTFLEKSNLTQLITEFPTICWYFLEDVVSELNWKDKLWILVRVFIPRLVDIAQRANDAALILFTSGSEGNAKAVVHSHNSLLANVEQIRTVLDPVPSDRFMSALPLFHAFGFTAGFLLPILSGSRVFLYPNPLHYRMVPEIVYDQNCTILFATPTFLSQYGKFAHPYDFMRLRYVIAGAERLPENTRELWVDKFGIRILEGYGVTECAPVISLNVPMAFKKGTVGRLLPGMSARLIPVPGLDVGGRLQVSGPNVMKGYMLTKEPGVLEKTEAKDANGKCDAGWYDTGDIVSIDKDGFLTIQGRIKRFAKIAGEMVALEAVEEIAHQADPNADHGVSLKHDKNKGETLVLFTTSKIITRERLSQAAKALGMPALAVPRDIRYASSLPLLGSGKVDFLTLDSMVEERSTGKDKKR